jgi:acyl transferase domain-containing protein
MYIQISDTSIAAACSSALSGVHMAYNSIILGHCTASSASGINLLLHPTTLGNLQKAAMLTLDGRCKALSDAADGYVRAEACGTILMQGGAVSLRDCVILIAGSAVNQDGRSSSLTAPNGPAQQEVMRAALAAGQIMHDDMAALQMHGTGVCMFTSVSMSM